MVLDEKIDQAVQLKKDLKINEALEILLEILQDPTIDDEENYKRLSFCLFLTADIYETLHNYDEVVWYCQELIKNNYGYKDPYILLAKVYNEMFMPTLAIACLDAMEKFCIAEDVLVYEDCELLTNDAYSVAYSQMGDIDKALEYNDKVLDADEDNIQALKNQRKLLKAKN